MHQKQLTCHSSRIGYEIEGNGPPVMLIHGFAEDGMIWQYQRALLKRHYTLIIPDLPGSGQSDILSPGGFQSSSAIEMYAAVLKQILDRENIGQCTFMGHSMGGYVALAFARHYPECLNGLGLIHSTAFPDNDEKKAMRSKGIKFMQRFGAKEFLKQSIPNLFGAAFTQQYPEQIEAHIKRSEYFDVVSLVQYYEAMMERPDRTDMLEKLSVPVLFIIGEEDRSVSLEDSLKQCSIPSRTLVHILPDTAHMGMWEQKDRTGNAMMEFLDYINPDSGRYRRSDH